LCRSNAVVESHFKSVKHGRLEGRLRVRPRSFVAAELKYVQGKLNERKLPKFRVRRSKDIAASEEKWRRGRRPARYTDTTSASRLLRKLSSRLRKTEKDHAPAVHTSEAVGVDDSAAGHAQGPRTSHDASSATTVPQTVSCVHDKELDGDAISDALEHLRRTYPEIDGLQPPGLGQCVVGKSMPRFQAVTRPFVQVLNVGDHWVTATNRFGDRRNDVFWFDSLHGRVSPSSALQLTSLLRRCVEADRILVNCRLCAHQGKKSRLSGYYALAFAYAICNGTDPSGFQYDAQTMVDVIDSNLSSGTVDEVPPAARNAALSLRQQTIDKRHCVCHRPSSISKSAVTMIECTYCANWFHVECVSTTARQRRRDSAVWAGPCCQGIRYDTIRYDRRV